MIKEVSVLVWWVGRGDFFAVLERQIFCLVPGLCCQLHFHTRCWNIKNMCCVAGNAFRDRTGGPRRHRRAPDVLYSHLPKWVCPARSKTLLQHQTWRDGQFSSKVLFLCICITPFLQASAVQSVLQVTDRLIREKRQKKDRNSKIIGHIRCNKNNTNYKSEIKL